MTSSREEDKYIERIILIIGYGTILGGSLGGLYGAYASGKKSDGLSDSIVNIISTGGTLGLIAMMTLTSISIVSTSLYYAGRTP